MSSYCVIGSGISGATIANLLSKKNSVHIYDKARGPGGRSSFKRLNMSKGFDHGTQYISPKSIQFKKFITNLCKKKILKIWSGKHIFLNKLKKENKNHVKIIGCKGNNDIIKHLIKNINCNFQSELEKIQFINNKWKLDFKNNQIKYYDKLILTCPFPQLKKLAGRYLEKKISNLKIQMQPNITVMVALTNKKELPLSSIKFDDNMLAWAANENSKKRFKSNLNLWTLQASLTWSKKTINKYKTDKSIMNKLISKFTQLTGLKKNKIIHKKIHGWKYSYSYQKTSLLSNWNKKYQLGICGDWFGGPKVENAWLSANDLAKKIK